MPCSGLGKRLRRLFSSQGPYRVSIDDQSVSESSKPESPAVASQGSSQDQAHEPPQETHDLWLQAHAKLKKDEKNSEILAAAGQILEKDFNLRIQSDRSAARNQLCTFLDAKVGELEEKKWVVKLGDHSIRVQEQLTRTCRNVLSVREVVSTVAATSPPAAIACAGVMVSFLLVAQVADQHESLLQGLEFTSALIPRLRLVEDLYSHSDEGIDTQIIDKSKEQLVSLYCKVIEFQARALCHLQKRTVSRHIRNMFKQEGWDDLLKEIQDLDNSTEKFTSRIENAEVRKRLEDIQNTLSDNQVWRTNSTRDEKMKRFFNLLYTCPYRDRKDRNSKRVPGTCEWFTSHARFQAWEEKDHSAFLWVSADPGCGKSVLTKFLIDYVLPKPGRTVCYFFFKDDFQDQKSAANALSAILRQLFIERPHLLSPSVLDKMDTDGKIFVESFDDLWNILLSVGSDKDAGEITCVLDALDECQENDRKQLTRALQILYSERPEKHNLKFLVTSRPYEHIRRGFQILEKRSPTIHLSGEDEDEVRKISHEIDLVIKKRVEEISNLNNLQQDECFYLQKELTSVENRTYLWVSLTLDVIENMSGFTKGNIRRAIRNLPQNVDEAYDRILNRSPDKTKAKKLLHIVTAAERPLTLRELALAMVFDAEDRSVTDILDDLEKDDEKFSITLRDLCGLFLVIIDTKVYLLHQTAKEFLVPSSGLQPESRNIPPLNTSWKHCLKPEESHKVLATVCMTYLTHKFEEEPMKFFLNYAACYWPSHFRGAFGPDAQEAAKLGKDLCQPESETYKAWSLIYKYEIQRLPEDSSAVLIASSLGVAAVVKLLLETKQVDLDSKDSRYGRTPLSWAAEKGHEAVVKLLLETKQVDLDSKDSEYGRTPLSWAARNGHEAVVKLLLETNQHKMGVRQS
ncbi:hypothetical protein BDV06DRAFT_225432 [Aspergillus oleicola]